MTSILTVIIFSILNTDFNILQCEEHTEERGEPIPEVVWWGWRIFSHILIRKECNFTNFKSVTMEFSTAVNSAHHIH